MKFLPLICALALSACSFVPPSAPVPASPLPDGNKLDAGIYYNAADKCLHARQFYFDRYAWLVKTYGAKIVPPVTDAAKGFTKLPSGEYRVTIEVTTNFQRLDRFSHNNP